ncbi:MAG: envelope stress response membrane protein PspB [Alphaproteobacteria bacterium]|nr:MAG: envelope stress response membrane protein PspB [Alphaproteobacteria bacterium]
MFFIVIPLWIVLHYATAWKKTKMLSPEDEATLGELRRTAEKLEERLKVMERILDDEIPDWRSRYHDRI